MHPYLAIALILYFSSIIVNDTRTSRGTSYSYILHNTEVTDLRGRLNTTLANEEGVLPLLLYHSRVSRR